MAIRRTRWVLIVLALVALASLWRTVQVERDKREIAAAYQQAQQLASQLSEERDHLNQELSSTKQTMEGQAGEMEGLKHELSGVQDRLDETVTQLAALQREHETLRNHNSSLTTQLTSVTQEKEALAAKLSSLKELRLAIHGVKQKIRDEQWAAWRAHVEAARRADQEALASGNHGYVMRNGVSTLAAAGATPRMNVHVLEPQTQ